MPIAFTGCRWTETAPPYRGRLQRCPERLLRLDTQMWFMDDMLFCK